MTHPSLAEMIARLHKLPAMPAVAMELLSSLSDDNTEVDALARRIAQDQAIAARVLRVANSPFYGLQTQVGSIRDAIQAEGSQTYRVIYCPYDPGRVPVPPGATADAQILVGRSSIWRSLFDL